jgi:hypothetical protein
MKYFIILFLATLIYPNEWIKYFQSKGAEVSSYKTVQLRYGELRECISVLIFVPEHLNIDTRIKVENYQATKPEKQIQVLKLNRVLKFNTGVYDYSLMTSVYSAAKPLFGAPSFYPMKISIAVTEWCGNYYGHIIPETGKVRSVSHSYFEAEGDKDYYLNLPPDFFYEDNFPIIIREFNGEFMKIGEKRSFNILPSLWSFRIAHIPLSFEKGTIDKKTGDSSTIKWVLSRGSFTTEYWTSKEYPHKILRWKDSEGGSGELIESIQEKYWQKHGNADLPLRTKLGLQK